MNVHFAGAIPDQGQETVRDRVSALRNDLKRTMKSEGVVDVHQIAAQVSPSNLLHIVSDDSAALVALWPKPHKRQRLDAQDLHDQTQEAPLQTIDCTIHRPFGKRDGLPIVQIELLQMLSSGNCEIGPQRVVKAAQDRVQQSAFVAEVRRIAFTQKVLRDFIGIEWQKHLRAVVRYVGGDVIKPSVRAGSPEAARRAPIADNIPI
jgi:hypothetical protein